MKEKKQIELSPNSRIAKAIVDLELRKFQRSIDLIELHKIIVALDELDIPLRHVIGIANEAAAEGNEVPRLSISESIEAADPVGTLLAIRHKLTCIGNELRELAAPEPKSTESGVSEYSVRSDLDDSLKMFL